MDTHPNSRPLVSAGTLLGIGLGGFVDGIVFHQLMQVHNMLSARYPKSGVPPETAVVNIEIDMFWDGLFHARCWVAAAAGLALLWNAVRRADVPLSTRIFAGSMFMGWGLFNPVEGIIDHHVLHVHHVTGTANHLVFELAFLTSGVAFIVLGLWSIRTGQREPAPRGRMPATSA
jgi:uncharacterized membrane protein